MKTYHRFCASAVRAAALLLAVTLGNVASAQQPVTAPQTRTWVYSAKFVCRNVFSTSATDVSFDFGPAFYRTVLNLHNTGSNRAELRIRAVEATRLGGAIGAVGHTAVVVAPQEAVFLSCADMRRILQLEDPQRRIDGYVIVESEQFLDADAVYTALSRRPDGSADSPSIDVETIRPRVKRSDVPTGSL